MSTVYFISILIVPIILAITVHEVAHGWAALKYGDDTALRAGRITLNPLAHIHPVGTILMPGLLLLAGMPPFGFAKPVPVNFARLHHPKRDMVWVAGAGPSVNIVMAVGGAALLKLVTFLQGSVAMWLADSLNVFIQINLVLAVLNLIPLPPLDGGRIAVGLLPMPLARRFAQLERYGLIIVFAVILLPYLANELFGTNYSIVGVTIIPVIESLYTLLIDMFAITGA